MTHQGHHQTAYRVYMKHRLDAAYHMYVQEVYSTHCILTLLLSF